MNPTEPGSPSIDLTRASAPQSSEREADPLVNTWFSRIKAGQKHWDKLHKRMRHNRKVVRGIDDNAEPDKACYNQHRANLIASTLTVVLSKVYAKNPEMAAQPTNKAMDLRLFADTVSTVTQTMLEDAGLKKKAKAWVRAAMTCSFGVVKVQYQRVTAGESDPIMRSRIQDSQDNILRLEGLIAACEDEKARSDHEAKLAELKQVMAGLQAQSEVVAAEGLVIDRVSSDRLVVDPAVEDVWEYVNADWMAEKIPMRKSKARAQFKDFNLDSATTYAVAETGKDHGRRQAFAPVQNGGLGDDAMVMVWEVWSRADNRIYTLVEGCNKQFAVAPYTPKLTGERWWPYFLLPFQSVDGEFAAQSLVDVLERLQDEHNETRDKFAEVRRNIKPHFLARADLKDKDIQKRTVAGIAEIITINTEDNLDSVFREAQQLKIDPLVFDTAPIRNDWEQVSGLSDAARSVVVQPKTATEAAISDQSLAARVAEFRDQIEDGLTEIAQYSSELCLLAMTPAQVETIMGAPVAEPEEAELAEVAAAALSGQPAPLPEPPEPTYIWPGTPQMPGPATPESVFNLIQLKVRAGSTAAPNKLEMQDNWNKALQLLMPMIDKIRAVEAAGGDATPERELVKETAARFDETIDIERFLPVKPQKQPVMPVLPGAAPGGPQPALPQPAVPVPAQEVPA